MAETNRPKAETKRPGRRSTTATERTKTSKAKDSAEEKPAAEAPVVEIQAIETSPEEVPAEEHPTVEIPTVEEPASDETSAEEIRKAEKLLRSNGYLLIPYGKIGRAIARSFGAGVGFVSGAYKGICGWLSRKYAAMKVRREEKRRVTAATVELPTQSIRCVACGAELVPGARFCRKCGKPIVDLAPSTKAGEGECA